MHIMILCLFATLCSTWLIFATIYTLAKYTDFGKATREQTKKKNKIQNSEDDLPIQDVDLNSFSSPTIETSFGEERIGVVYKHEHES